MAYIVEKNFLNRQMVIRQVFYTDNELIVHVQMNETSRTNIKTQIIHNSGISFPAG